MKLRRIGIEASWVVASVCLGVWAAHAASGASSEGVLAVQGTLTDATGQGVTTSHSIDLTVVNDANGNSCSYTMPYSPQDLTGHFASDFSVQNCVGSVFDGGDLHFEAAVDGNAIITNGIVAPVPYAKYADELADTDCPVGYQRDTSVSSVIVCRSTAQGQSDEVVKVGTGGSAFWIDRFEDSLWQSSAAVASASGLGDFSADGQMDAANPYVALSVDGQLPTTGVTWLQAAAACAAAGKKLPTSDQWLAAAAGSPDPTSPSDGTGGTCNTASSGATRAAGGGTACSSAWGAEDMVGNLWEWTAEWVAGVGDSTPTSTPFTGASFTDSVDNTAGKARVAGSLATGAPAVMLRGGGLDGTSAGVFALRLDESPLDSTSHIGLRCVIP